MIMPRLEGIGILIMITLANEFLKFIVNTNRINLNSSKYHASEQSPKINSDLSINPNRTTLINLYATVNLSYEEVCGEKPNTP